MKIALPRVFSDLIALLFPSVCLGCNQALNQSNTILCMCCEIQLPMAYHKNQINMSMPLSEEFIPSIKGAFSLYLFEENSVIEKMLYQLKYNGNKPIGSYFGRKLGGYLWENDIVLDGIIGVPLHHKRLRKRGFNQVDIIGKKLSEALNIPYIEDHIKRIKHTPPLSKVKTNRKTILVDAFQCISPQRLAPGHYLLLDDIFTTGITLRACAEVLLSTQKITLSIATVALRI